MYLENIVFDAVKPGTLGRHWQHLLGCEQLTDDPAGFETRLGVEGGPVLDLCFQPVKEPTNAPHRLRLDLAEGELVAIRLESADPARDAELWAWLTGWTPDGPDATTLRHPSRKGPLLELIEEAGAKTAKNAIHLDVRLEEGDDADVVEAGIRERGGRPDPHPEWGELPWRTYQDGSGNEFCVLRRLRPVT